MTGIEKPTEAEISTPTFPGKITAGRRTEHAAGKLGVGITDGELTGAAGALKASNHTQTRINTNKQIKMNAKLTHLG